MTSGAILLPPSFQRRLDAFARDFLAAPAGRAVDFARPPGEAALVPADSLSWMIFKNPITLFIGGVTGVLLELAEPRVRDGVWQHSSFRQDALARLRRTGLAAMVTVYGPQSAAEAMISGVRRMHERVEGRTSEGHPYAASDPELLVWVQATAGYGFVEAYAAHVRPLTTAERDRLYREAQPAALLYGAVGAPASQADLDALFEAMRPRLVASPIVHEFLRIMEAVPAFPAPLRPFQRLLIRAAVALLPHGLRDRLGLGARWSLRPWQRGVVATAARLAERLVIRSSPAVQSCRRLGLPDDYLYRAR